MVGKDEARSLAEAVCRERGLPFSPPIRFAHGLMTIDVVSAADHIGGNVVVTIGRWDGKIRRVWVNPK